MPKLRRCWRLATLHARPRTTLNPTEFAHNSTPPAFCWTIMRAAARNGGVRSWAAIAQRRRPSGAPPRREYPHRHADQGGDAQGLPRIAAHEAIGSFTDLFSVATQLGGSVTHGTSGGQQSDFHLGAEPGDVRRFHVLERPRQFLDVLQKVIDLTIGEIAGIAGHL